VISGGSDLAVLYGAYRFAEKLGVRFYLHGDVIPDKQIPLVIARLDEHGSPLFERRGIQPFHDFTEGPDWWSLDDYKNITAQLVKMRMNWMGFHCYPEGGLGPEPLVWIGLPEDVNADGSVKWAYPSRWASTSGGSWGYAAAKTSDFAAGAGLLFPADDFGSPVTEGLRPQPKTAEESAELFNRGGRFFSQAFGLAERLGVMTVIGTETPLVIPKALKKRLLAKGLDPASPETVEKLYRGMFLRIQRMHSLGAYWVWTSENWTWRGNTRKQLDVVLADFKAATTALDELKNPFIFGTCGWVLGPSQDRSLFDKTLPQDAAAACISRGVGFDPIEPGFMNIGDRPKWAIPWMEDDSAMILPQLWVGRTRRDAADAYAYGCTGLMGIHWRTKILAPNFAALAASAWDQAGWNPTPGKRIKPADKQLNGYEKDLADVGRKAAAPTRDLPRDFRADDFYYDWCRSNFGSEVGDEMAAIFIGLDGGPGKSYKKNQTLLPRPANWIAGPGGIVANKRPWEIEKKRYAFVDEMEKLRSQVKGAGNLARFDYWLNSFRYLRSVGRISCTHGAFDKAMLAVARAKGDKTDAVAKALALRIQLARDWEKMMTLQLAATDTTGEMGTIANLEQHVRRNPRGRGSHRFLDSKDKDLEKALGKQLPESVHPTTAYLGKPRLIVPTPRSLRDPGEVLNIRTILLDSKPPKKLVLKWRVVGKRSWHKLKPEHLGRGVWQFSLPGTDDATVEYQINAEAVDGTQLQWPAVYPQSVVVLPNK
jgi:hypothetical protein